MIQVIKDAGEARRLRNERAEAVAKVDALQAEVGKLNELLRRTNEQLATASAKSKEYEEAIKRAQIPPIPLDMPNPSTWQKSA